MIRWVHFEYFMHSAVVRSQRLSVAHLFDDDAVVTGAVQAQVLQDGSDLQQSQPVAGGGARGGDVKTAAKHGTQTHRCVCCYLSICERNFVSKMPLVFSVSEICPLNKNPRLVISIRMFRTISPRYKPLHIFSYL